MNMKRILLLLMLLPAASWAAEPQPVPGQNPALPASSPAQSSLSLPLAVSDARCDLIARSNAMYWYTATLCAQRHKDMRPQEEKIKNLIASTYPGFHRAITLPPYSAFGRAEMDNLPYRPDSNPFLDKKSCKVNFGFLMRNVKETQTRQTILQCWEQPTAAKAKPPSPLDDKVCVGAAQYLASAWYRAGMCTARHQGLAAREAKIKEQLAATYPDFQKAISTPPILDAGKYMATYSLSDADHDPNLSEEGCEANLDFLETPLQDTDWKNAVEQCWGKPRTAAQEQSSAAR